MRLWRKGRVEDDKKWTVEREVEYTETCTPNGKVVLIAIIGALLALLLLALAIIMILWEWGYFDTDRTVYRTTEVPAPTVPTQIVGSTLEPPTVSVSQGPLTTTTTVATTTTEEPCIDYEPYLCEIAWYEWLCDTRFGQSQCCWTCYVARECRDLVEGCHKIPLYGLCDNPRYMKDCCASCVYVEP